MAAPSDWIEQYLRMPVLIGANLIFWGLVLWFADRYSRSAVHPRDHKTMRDMSWKQALLIGIAQALALFPGTSRSGITISAGLLTKLQKEEAIEFSFIMSIPIIAAAGILKFLDLLKSGFGTLTPTILTSGFLSSLLGGLAALWLLTHIVRRYSFTPFVVYRIVIGALVLLFLQ